MTGVPERTRFLVVAAALALCLVAGSPARIVGDGGEYLAQALNFAALDGPSLGRQAIPELEQRIAALAPNLSAWSIEQASVPGPDRRRDFLHFWFYALLATPFVWVTELLSVSPLHAFTALNMLLAGAAIAFAGPRIGAPATVLLFLGPLVWWIDKAHTEVFTVALLAIALVAMRDRPWLAPLAAGAAATQNPPIAVVTVLIVGAQVVASRGGLIRDRHFVAGAIGGVALAALQPAYTWVRHDTPSLLLYATREGLPTWAELSYALFDPSMGLVGNYPMLLGGTLAAAGVLAFRHRPALATPECAAALGAAAVFLYAFAQTSNPHHGATPSLTRYALWFIPLTIPLWRSVHEQRALGTRALWVGAIASAVVSIFAFHPGVPQNSREPTWLASWLWGGHPTWHQPLPEIFSETHLGVEGTVLPAATPNCGKILLRADPAGSWPLACLPSEIAPGCRAPGTLCYANRDGASYTFSRVPGRPIDARFVPEAAWPAEAEPHVRRLLLEAGWPSMADAGVVPFPALRQRHDVRVAAYGEDDRLLLILQVVGPSPSMRLRPIRPLDGTLFAARTGEPVGHVRLHAGTDDLQDVVLPPGDDLFILMLTESSIVR